MIGDVARFFARPRPLRVYRHLPGVPTSESFAVSLGDPLTLDVGSADRRLPVSRAINLDIVPGRLSKGDIAGDAQWLPIADDSVDLVVLSAVLQYLREPRRAVREAVRVLKPGGWLYLQCPFIQPVCEDGLDQVRYTRRGLEMLANDLTVECESGMSISGGSALAFYVLKLLDVDNRYLSFAFRLGASIPLWVLAHLHLARRDEVAAAFWFVGRKPPGGRGALVGFPSMASDPRPHGHCHTPRAD